MLNFEHCIRCCIFTSNCTIIFQTNGRKSKFIWANTRSIPKQPKPTIHSLANPAEWMFSDNESKTGIAVTENSAMQLSAVFGAVRVISETMATLPGT